VQPPAPASGRDQRDGCKALPRVVGQALGERDVGREAGCRHEEGVAIRRRLQRRFRTDVAARPAGSPPPRERSTAR